WYFTSGSNYLTHGFIRLSDGSYLTYDDPYAGTSTLHKGTQIRGVNDALALVGAYYDGSNHRHGYFIQGLLHITLDDPFAGPGGHHGRHDPARLEQLHVGRAVRGLRYRQQFAAGSL